MRCAVRTGPKSALTANLCVEANRKVLGLLIRSEDVQTNRHFLYLLLKNSIIVLSRGN